MKGFQIPVKAYRIVKPIHKSCTLKNIPYILRAYNLDAKIAGNYSQHPIRFIERERLVVLEKVNVSLNSLCGMVSARKSASLEDMCQAIGDAVTERFGRANAGR